jgi:hypothetical protein
MHYCVFVMIGPDTDIETGVAKALAPFEEALTVEPYRIHFDHSEVQWMSAYFNIPPANLHELAKRMPDWTGDPGGVDREGLYRLAAFNPDGRWDWYEIGGRWGGYIPHSRGNALKAKTLANAAYLKDCLPYFVLTPDGEWLEHERYYVAGDLESVKTEQLKDGEWLAIVRETLLRWPDHRVVCVDIHC